jgi:pyruvate dehydrogenase E2 component (dihydrolipoamide acetyltransferase)
VELGRARRAAGLRPKGSPGPTGRIAGRIGSITVSNIGDQGVETLSGVIYRRRWLWWASGRSSNGPLAEGGLLGVRATVHATPIGKSSRDDGHQGGLFLAAIDRRVQRPEAAL